MIVEEIAYAVQARARLWNLMLDGSEAYENERWLLHRLQAIVPDIARLARNERAFTDRCWRFATGLRGIQQVVHVGAPLPAGHPPHKALAQPGRVVYVEGDELLYRKGSAWMTEAGVDVVSADPLDVPAMLDAIEGRINWLDPVAVIAPSVLSWVDDGQARTWVIQIVDELPPGSFLAATHLLDPGVSRVVSPLQHTLHSGAVGMPFFRRREAIEALFPGLTLETPGVTRAVDWWPNGPRLHDLSLADQLLAAVVATVPRSP